MLSFSSSFVLTICSTEDVSSYSAGQYFKTSCSSVHHLFTFTRQVLDLGPSQLAVLRAHVTHLCIRLLPTPSDLELRFELSSSSSQQHQQQLASLELVPAGSAQLARPPSSSGTSSDSLLASYARLGQCLALFAPGLALPLLDLELPHSAHLYRMLSLSHWPDWRTAFLLRVQPGQCLSRRRMLIANPLTPSRIDIPTEHHILYSYC